MAQQTPALPPGIQNGLNYLNDQDVWTFRKRFRQQSSDRRLLAHTKIELIVGVFSARSGFTPQYEREMEGQTPDWLFLDRADKPHFFGDVLNFHMQKDIEKKIEDALQTRHSWSDELPDSQKRLHPSLRQKAGKYKDLADKVNLPFVVFVYGWSVAFLHQMEIEDCLRNPEYGLFKGWRRPIREKSSSFFVCQGCQRQ